MGAAVLSVLLVVHMVLGLALLIGRDAIFTRPVVVLAWVAIAVAGGHVLLSVVTSIGQMTDKDRPPSRRKMRHLILKWLTGLALVALVIAHASGWHASPLSTYLPIILVTAAMCWHFHVGVKSLLSDLDLPRSWQRVLENTAVLVAFVVGLVCVLLALR